MCTHWLCAFYKNLYLTFYGRLWLVTTIGRPFETDSSSNLNGFMKACKLQCGRLVALALFIIGMCTHSPFSKKYYIYRKQLQWCIVIELAFELQIDLNGQCILLKRAAGIVCLFDVAMHCMARNNQWCFKPPEIYMVNVQLWLFRTFVCI